MLGGFDPRTQSLFLERRRTAAMLAALVLYASVVVWALREREQEVTVDVQLDPEIKDFAVEPEPEPEIEEEPPPPPPPDAEVRVVQKPTPKPRIAPPDEKVTEAPPESDRNKVVEMPAGPTSPGGQGDRPVKAKPEKPSKPPAKPEPPPEPKAKTPSVDPTKPIDRPENATMPKPDPGNAQPDYPAQLRDKGVTGEVVLKVHIHRDGSVRGAKILRKKNSATTDEEKKLADKLFVAAVVKVVKTWKYTPAKLNGQPISIWFPVTFPFKLTAG